MKHTTFENELRDIRRRAINELRKAIKAHGGHVEWEDGDMPSLKYDDVYIERINDRLFASVISDGYYTLSVDDMSIEQIIAITEAIPETDEVKDVSGVYPAPVTWVDLDDIESEGFDTSDLTQEKLNRIAEIMQEYSCLPTQHEIRTSDLYAACTKVDLKQKED